MTTVKDFFKSKGIDPTTVPGFKTPNVNGKQTFFLATGIMEEFAKIKCKEQHRNTRHQAAELAVRDSELHRDIMNLEQL